VIGISVSFGEIVSVGGHVGWTFGVGGGEVSEGTAVSVGVSVALGVGVIVDVGGAVGVSEGVKARMVSVAA